MEKYIGKITSAKLGEGGYDDAMFGFSFGLDSTGGGCGDFWGTWAKRAPDAKWSEQEQLEIFGKAMARCRDLMKDAKVSDFKDLKGKPIEITFNNGRLHSWRILTEVL